MSVSNKPGSGGPFASHRSKRPAHAVQRHLVSRLLPPLCSLFLASCGPAFLPEQARFVVTGCDSVAGRFDATSIEWDVHAAPVLQRGEAGAWDSVDVLNPSVVKVGDTYYNLYSGFDGTSWHTGLATSRDGVGWERHGVVLSPSPDSWESGYIAANGSLAFDGEQFLYWYQAGPRGHTRLALATSRNARDWVKHPRPVLEAGAAGSWEESAVGDPYVARCGDSFYLYYLGQNRRALQRLGLARSADGIHWQKSHRNPILDTGGPGEFDEIGLGEPAVFFAAERFYMLYTGRDRQESRRIGWAQSDDGVNWDKIPAELLAGAEPWNTAVVCDPAIWPEKDQILVWFGGGKRPSPDENLEGEIGLARLRLAAPAESR